MTKKEYEKYNKEVRDKFSNLLKPGDIVVFPDGYLNDVHIGVVSHFTDSNVIIRHKNTRWTSDYIYKSQRSPDRIIKVRDKDGKYVQFENPIESENNNN